MIVEIVHVCDLIITAPGPGDGCFVDALCFHREADNPPSLALTLPSLSWIFLFKYLYVTTRSKVSGGACLRRWP